MGLEIFNSNPTIYNLTFMKIITNFLIIMNNIIIKNSTIFQVNWIQLVFSRLFLFDIF